MDELFERRRTVRVGGIDVATLDAVDGLLDRCLHGSLSCGDQLVSLKDLDQMVESEPTDWDELIRRARRYRWIWWPPRSWCGHGLYRALRYPRRWSRRWHATRRGGDGGG
jgi:hypothetical protein